MRTWSFSKRTTDPAVFGRVGVLFGGQSAERAVSLESGRSVLAALRRQQIQVQPIDGSHALTQVLHARQCDRIFHVLHGVNGGGEDGIVQGLMQAYDIPFTGSGVLGSALSIDKVRSKQVWQALALSTPRYRALTAPVCAEELADVIADLGLPVIVKPNCEGSSIGITQVSETNQLAPAVTRATKHGPRVLVEQLIQGDELTIAIIGQHVLPSIRIVPKESWFDYAAKYLSDQTSYVCPGLDPQEEFRAGALALAAFKALGCSGWGRVDLMRARDDGQLYLLEVNTAPGMTSHSLVPKAAHQCGVNFDDLVWCLLEQTL